MHNDVFYEEILCLLYLKYRDKQIWASIEDPDQILCLSLIQ